MLKFCINSEEIPSRGHENFEEQNKVLDCSMIIINYCFIVIINAYCIYIVLIVINS